MGVRAGRTGAALGALLYCLLGVALLFAANWCYQVIRKPTELFGPFGPASVKTPQSTWQSYGPLFRAHATDVISAELLAALVQVESQGNPLARTYWRWRWSWNPLNIYAPASSAVGLLQITDGAFEEAKRYCIRNNQVATTGPWYDLQACWFNGLYNRAIPSHSIEMTAARLHTLVAATLKNPAVPRATLAQKQDLAAVLHLCGAERAAAFARRHFRVSPGERCGDHDLMRYLARFRESKRGFTHLAAAE